MSLGLFPQNMEICLRPLPIPQSKHISDELDKRKIKKEKKNSRQWKAREKDINNSWKKRTVFPRMHLSQQGSWMETCVCVCVIVWLVWRILAYAACLLPRWFGSMEHIWYKSQQSAHVHGPQTPHQASSEGERQGQGNIWVLSLSFTHTYTCTLGILCFLGLLGLLQVHLDFWRRTAVYVCVWGKDGEGLIDSLAPECFPCAGWVTLPSCPLPVFCLLFLPIVCSSILTLLHTLCASFLEKTYSFIGRKTYFLLKAEAFFCLQWI